MATFGRNTIYTDYPAINRDNVVQVIKESQMKHLSNSLQIEHLINYYKGNQPILQRIKETRPEIINKCIVNHANEIVSFKVSYLLSEPITYINRSGDNDNSEKIKKLNEFMYLEDKSSKDKEIADFFSICGVAYRMILPNANYGDNVAPFDIYTLDPRYTYVIRHNSLGYPVVAGVKYITKENGEQVFSVYTKKEYFEIINNQITFFKSHSLGEVPIIEYVNNDFKIGAFEVVETLLNTINILESSRIDATEQAVQALLVFENCEIDTEQYEEMRKKGAVKIKSIDGNPAKVYNVGTDMNQSDQQVLMNSIYRSILTITGMPQTGDGNSSDSSNNGAIIVKSGWYHAEARAKDTELLWRRSERQFLKIALQICKQKADLEIPLSAVHEKFTRRNYEDIMTKATTLTTLLNNNKVHPRVAYQTSGIAVDPEEAYMQGMEWYEQVKKEEKEQLQNQQAKKVGDAIA